MPPVCGESDQHKQYTQYQVNNYSTKDSINIFLIKYSSHEGKITNFISFDNQIMEFGIFIDQIVILGILVLIGIFASRAGIIRGTVKDGLAKIIINITLPLLVLTGISGMDVSVSLLENSVFTLLFSLLMVIFMGIIGFLSSKLSKLPSKSSSVHLVHTMFGNIVYLGFPLINALFPGGEALYYAMLFHLVTSTVMWTFGISVLQGGGGNSWRHGVKKLLNINTLAFAVGFLMLSLSLRLPPVMENSLGGLGKTTIYLSMLYIGAMLAGVSWKQAIFSLQAYLLAWNKLILIPIIGLLMYKGLEQFFSVPEDELAVMVILLESAMPCMVNIVVLAKVYGADDEMATQNVFITTLLSILSLPVVYFVFRYYI